MKISIVTPTFHRSEYLNDTVQSVVSQSGDFDIEYIIQDGGSGNEVFECLEHWKTEIESRRFKPQCRSLSFKYYVEPDKGMYNAINKGFSKSTGDVLAWINSDDIYFPVSFRTVEDIFESNPDIDWLVGQTSIINANGAVTYTEKRERAIGREFVKRGYYRQDLPPFYWLPQDSVFWRRSLWEKAGPLDEHLKMVSDLKLWQQFAEYSEPVKVLSALGAYRQHGEQFTANPEAYVDELGPPPSLPFNVKMASVYGSLLRKYRGQSLPSPDRMLVPRLLGLSGRDLIGTVAAWDFESSQWTIRKFSVL